MPDAQTLRAYVAAMPKVDLHRHLEGSIRLETLLEVARQYRIPLPSYDLETLRPHVQMTPYDHRDLDTFLGKFGVLRRFYRSAEVVDRITREVVADAAADHVRYLELRFTPYALASQMYFPLREVIRWVADAARSAAEQHGIRVGLIVSINRHERIEIGLQTILAALECNDSIIVGVDLAGREVGYPARPFAPMLYEAQQAGLGVTIHAGEWTGPDTVRDAIENMHADRIGHGMRIIEDSRAVKLARDCGVAFEMCPTSNYQTGTIHEVAHHPLRDLYSLGLAVTINTDDPAISGITLTDELYLATEAFSYSPTELWEATLTAARASFLPVEERPGLYDDLAAGLERLNATPAFAAIQVDSAVALRDE